MTTIHAHRDSHVDHGISPEQLAAALALASERLPESGIAVLTVRLPEELGTVPCALYGPAMGDGPVSDDEVALCRRGERSGESRMCARPVRQVRAVTVVAGPHDGESWVLFTAYGGPAAPREPWDESLDGAGLAESCAFWDAHALAATDAETRLSVALEVLSGAAESAVYRDPYAAEHAHVQLERATSQARAVLRETRR